MSKRAPATLRPVAPRRHDACSSRASPPSAAAPPRGAEPRRGRPARSGSRPSRSSPAPTGSPRCAGQVVGQLDARQPHPAAGVRRQRRRRLHARRDAVRDARRSTRARRCASPTASGPEAVWSDGDADHVGRLRVHVEADPRWRTSTPTGYDHIESIDTTDPKVAVVTFSEPYAVVARPVRRLLLRAPEPPARGQEPRQGDEGRLRVLRRPVEARRWQGRVEEGRSLTLVPNEAYWGTKPTIGKVIFQFVAESRGRDAGGEDRPGRRGVSARRPTACSTSSTKSRTSRTPSRSATSSRRSGSTRRVPARQPGGARGRRLRDRPPGDRRPDPAADGARRPRAAELHRADVPAVLHAGVREVLARPRHGRRAHDRRRLGEERRRHLGEGRRDGVVRGEHDGRPARPRPRARDLAEPARAGRLRRDRSRT